MIYVYAFCLRLPEPPALPAGIQAPRVELLTTDELGAIVEQGIDVSQLKEDDTALMQAVLAHDRVLGYFFDQTPLLPLRFGTQFKDLESVQKFLEDQGETYFDKLTALHDKAEYLLKLSPQPVEMPEITSELRGRDYFLAKKQRLQAQAAALGQQTEDFQQFLNALADAGIPFVQSAPQDAEERLHVLLDRDAVKTQQLFTAWQHQLPTWQLVCSEPLPPYHFAA